jgi:PAS domain S-box-containing protein
VGGLDKPEAKAGARAPGPAWALPDDEASVLLVDDREDNLLALEAMLRDLSPSLVRARSGRQALELLLARDFALILLDVRMPDMDGLETAELVRKRRQSRRTPIIFITASDPASSDVARGYSAGAVDYVFKPVVPEILRAKVRTFLDLYRKGEELRRSEAYTRVVLEKAFDAFVALDPEGRVVDWNPQAEATFGWTREEVLGRPLASLIIPLQFREANEQGLERYLSTGQGPALGRRIEMTALHRSGREFPVEMTISALEVGGSRLFASFLHDISERRASEAALRQAVQAAEASSRELESFSYSVSHDLRAPLRAIDGFSKLLADGSSGMLGKDEAHYLDRIRSASQRMGELIDDLLELAKVTRGQLRLQRIDLGALAGEVAEALLKSDPARKVRFSIADGLEATGDPRYLKVVLENLMGNAWKFTARHPEAHIEIGVVERDGRAAYFVRDDGAGFDMAYAGKLFGAFQRLHEGGQFEGTGIGLATVARIIARHGGRLWAEAAVEKGATFYFAL